MLVRAGGLTGGGGGKSKIAWRSDLFKSQDIQLHHGNVGIPQISGRGQGAGLKSNRFNDGFDIRTSLPKEKKKKNKKQKTSQ